MHIFVAFGYRPENSWISELVFPLIQYFDGTVITGEDLEGKPIDDTVKELIKGSDGMLAFLTQREMFLNGKYDSHRWVSDELATAIDSKVPAVEVRDKEVSISGGIASNRQFISLDLDKKAELLVDLAKVLSKWRKDFSPKRLFLLPIDLIQDARPHIRTDQLICKYQFMEGNITSVVYETKPFRLGQGLCLDVKHVPSEESYIQVILKGPDFSWSSAYEPVKLLSINLQKD